MSRHFLIFTPLLLTGCIETGLTMVPGGAGSAVDANDDTGEWTQDPEEEADPEPNPEQEQKESLEAPEDDCDDTSDLVYVIDKDTAGLYLFNPQTYGYEFLGDLDCGTYAGTPASMSVSRDGFAYVRYADDTVYSVDLVSMECNETPYGTNFGGFGMGYATEDNNTWQDHLYVANASQLATIDTQNWKLSVIGKLPSQSELTGNAEGELWAMLPLETPAELVQLNKSNANVAKRIKLPGFPNPYEIDTFAFATWGGDFWLFIRTSGMGSSTDIYRVTAAGKMTRVVTDSGLNVVGAGVSTCAPTE